MIALKLLVLAVAAAVPAICQEPLLFWGYECQEGKCAKVVLSGENWKNAGGLTACKIYCGGVLGTVWPKPTGNVKIGGLVTIKRQKIKFLLPEDPGQRTLWQMNKRRFLLQVESKIRDAAIQGDERRKLTVKIKLNANDKEPALQLPSLRYDTDESYSLKISNNPEEVLAEITANSFFGARHGLETLSQVIVYDDIRSQLVMLGEAEIDDAPVFKHRGVLLDTGRNYFSVKSIKRTIDAMAMTKLNRFHWHIVDATSFPLVIKSQPDLHMIGAYSPRKIYTHEDIQDLVEYARARGVSIYPDFDSPGHAGEGWQKKNMTVCFRTQPWKYYCPLPPCGELDPTNEGVYSVLEDIYREIFEIFDIDVFHMGGSQVILQCWKDDDRINSWMREQGWGLETKDYVKLYGYFQRKALAKVDKVSPNKKVPIVLWSNVLAEEPYFDQHIDKSRYIIQVNSAKGAEDIKNVLKHGYKVIVSNHDALFLDCGFGSTTTAGNNWCSPYSGWQKIYENRLEEIAGEYIAQILGAEVTNWSEQLDEYSLDTRFWPRASSLGERLWSNPKESWREAEARLLVHRELLVENGIGPEAVQPEWCLQNQGECPKF